MKIVPDLHFGVELDKEEIGFLIPLRFEKYFKILPRSKEVLFLGDVKHNIFDVGPSFEKFFDEIAKKYERIIITKGNHDANIEKLTPKYKNVVVKDFYIEGHRLYFHGHKKLPKTILDRINSGEIKEIILGHLHPSLSFNIEKYDIMFRNYVKCDLVFEEGPKIKILSSVNDLVSGVNVLEIENRPLPLFKQLDLELDDFFIVVNGKKIGKIKNFKYK